MSDSVSRFNVPFLSQAHHILSATSFVSYELSMHLPFLPPLLSFWCSALFQVIYADLPSFTSPCLITGDSLRPDLLLLTGNNVLYILELTLDFETNMQVNSTRKANKYNRLIKDLSSTYNKVTFINLSMGALCVMGSSCDSFLSLLQDLSFDKLVQKRIIMKTINIAIRTSYFTFCQRNKPWNNPELLNI